MSAETLLLQGVALAFIGGAVVAALAAMLARSLFAMAMGLAVASACAAAAIMAMGQGDAALLLALFGAGLAPVLILAALLLTARTVKARAHAPIWIGAAGAAVAAGAMLWAAPELSAGAAAPVNGAGGAVSVWIAALVFVAATACAALLGYGERGALERTEPKR